MAEIPSNINPRSEVVSSITPTADTSLYPTHYSDFGFGGLRTVATIVERDAISTQRRVDGMLVYVEGDTTYYRLSGGITNTDWVEFDAGSGHVIKNFDSTLPQRANLQFIGSAVQSVTDDSDDDTTIVNIVADRRTIENSVGNAFLDRDTLRYTGSGVTVTDDASNDRLIINVPGLEVGAETVLDVDNSSSLQSLQLGNAPITTTLQIEDTDTNTITTRGPIFGNRNQILYYLETSTTPSNNAIRTYNLSTQTNSTIINTNFTNSVDETVVINVSTEGLIVGDKLYFQGQSTDINSNGIYEYDIDTDTLNTTIITNDSDIVPVFTDGTDIWSFDPLPTPNLFRYNISTDTKTSISLGTTNEVSGIRGIVFEDNSTDIIWFGGNSRDAITTLRTPTIWRYTISSNVLEVIFAGTATSDTTISPFSIDQLVAIPGKLITGDRVYTIATNSFETVAQGLGSLGDITSNSLDANGDTVYSFVSANNELYKWSLTITDSARTTESCIPFDNVVTSNTSLGTYVTSTGQLTVLEANNYTIDSNLTLTNVGIYSNLSPVHRIGLYSVTNSSFFGTPITRTSTAGNQTVQISLTADIDVNEVICIREEIEDTVTPQTANFSSVVNPNGEFIIKQTPPSAVNGHIIQNSDGNNLAQQLNLQFIGATLTNDNANERTVVTIPNLVGEVNTYSDLGTSTDGVTIRGTKTGSDLPFKRLKAGLNVTLAEETNDVLISVASTTVADLSNGFAFVDAGPIVSDDLTDAEIPISFDGGIL